MFDEKTNGDWAKIDPVGKQDLNLTVTLFKLDFLYFQGLSLKIT